MANAVECQTSRGITANPATEMPAAEQALCNATAHAALLHHSCRQTTANPATATHAANAAAPSNATQHAAATPLPTLQAMALPATEMPAAEQVLFNATALAALLHLLVWPHLSQQASSDLAQEQAHLCRGIQVLVQHRMDCVYMTKRMVGNAVMCPLGLLVVMAHNIQEIYVKQLPQTQSILQEL